MKQVIAMRTDLGMSKGKMIAQAVHSSKNPDCATVIVRVNSEEELEQFGKLARDFNVDYQIVRDAGKTQVEPGTATCCRAGPSDERTMDLISKYYKLL